MTKNKKLEMISQLLLSEMSLSNESYGYLMRKYLLVGKYSSEVKELNYAELCKLSEALTYTITIIQNDKVYETDTKNCFLGNYEHIHACYQINPFEKAVVIAQNINDSFKIFLYKPNAFEDTIILPRITCFKNLFEYFNVYKSDGSIAENLDDLKDQSEVLGISKQNLTYQCFGKDLPLHIILRWYKGYF